MISLTERHGGRPYNVCTPKRRGATCHDCFPAEPEGVRNLAIAALAGVAAPYTPEVDRQCRAGLRMAVPQIAFVITTCALRTQRQAVPALETASKVAVSDSRLPRGCSRAYPAHRPKAGLRSVLDVEPVAEPWSSSSPAHALEHLLGHRLPNRAGGALSAPMIVRGLSHLI